MELQSEIWMLLQDDEYRKIWDKVYTEFNFRPSINPIFPPFFFKVPVDIYDISNLPSEDEYDELMDKIIVDSFIECMGNDDFMYALDWQHSGFRYNPRIKTLKQSTFISDDRCNDGGYDACFPDFFPDGDYYFFISKDFTWGYLTHPWLLKAWVFGEPLKEYFLKNLDILKFIPCAE